MLFTWLIQSQVTTNCTYTPYEYDFLLLWRIYANTTTNLQTATRCEVIWVANGGCGEGFTAAVPSVRRYPSPIINWPSACSRWAKLGLPLPANLLFHTFKEMCDDVGREKKKEFWFKISMETLFTVLLLVAPSFSNSCRVSQRSAEGCFWSILWLWSSWQDNIILYWQDNIMLYSIINAVVHKSLLCFKKEWGVYYQIDRCIWNQITWGFTSRFFSPNEFWLTVIISQCDSWDLSLS